MYLAFGVSRETEMRCLQPPLLLPKSTKIKTFYLIKAQYSPLPELRVRASPPPPLEIKFWIPRYLAKIEYNVKESRILQLRPSSVGTTRQESPIYNT